MKKLKEKSNKILIASTSSDYGGGPKVVFDFLSHTNTHEFDFIVVAPPSGIYIKKFKELSLKVYEIPINKLNLWVLWDFYNLVKREKITLINSHGKGAGLYARLIGLVLRVPVVHTFHGIHVEQKLKIVRSLYIFSEKIFSFFTTKIINVSKSQEEQGLTLGLFPKSKSSVIYNGVDVESIDNVEVNIEELRRELDIGKSDFVLTTVARFDPVKGHERFVGLLPSVISLVPIKVLFVGDGQEQENIKKLVRKLGVQDKVRFLGFRNDVIKILKISDLLVAPSFREGLPTAVLEAMACKLPTIGANTIGINELVINGETGYLVDFDKDADKFKDVVLTLYQDGKLRREMGDRSREVISAKFSTKDFIENTLHLYQEILKIK